MWKSGMPYFFENFQRTYTYIVGIINFKYKHTPYNKCLIYVEKWLGMPVCRYYNYIC